MFLLAGALSLCVIWLMLRSGRVGPLDFPNHRSLHAVAVPRSGGLGILAGIGWAAAIDLPHWAVLAGVASLAVLSWWDDRHPLPVGRRLAGHVVAAGMLVLWGPVPDWAPMFLLLAALGVVWMTNLYNFMDGANGYAGGMSVIGFAAYAAAAWLAGQGSLAFFCAGIAASAAGFLWFNFDPARIFMGDAGSVPLGFLAGALGLQGIASGAWPLWFPLLVFSVFIVDATVTLLRRAIRGERVWEAHREHAYQRLVRTGWSHRRLALTGYLLMTMTAMSACAAIGLSRPLQWTVLTVWVLAFVLILWRVDVHARLPD